jgi:general secretion pathway protein E
MRLSDLGLERFLIASALRGLAAQRLARRLCPHCARPSTPSEAENHERLARLALKDAGLGELETPGQWKEPVGCSECQGSGYRGRIALFEVALIDEGLRNGILSGAPERELTVDAREQGFTTLVEDGMLKARSGVTTIEEVMRVCARPA